LWLGANTNYRLIGFPINMLLAVTRYNVHSVEIKQELQEKFQGVLGASEPSETVVDSMEWCTFE